MVKMSVEEFFTWQKSENSIDSLRMSNREVIWAISFFVKEKPLPQRIYYYPQPGWYPKCPYLSIDINKIKSIEPFATVPCYLPNGEKGGKVFLARVILRETVDKDMIELLGKIE